MNSKKAATRALDYSIRGALLPLFSPSVMHKDTMMKVHIQVVQEVSYQTHSALYLILGLCYHAI